MVRIRMTIQRGETQERRQLRRRGEHHRRGQRRREHNRYVAVLTAQAGGVRRQNRHVFSVSSKESLLVGGVDVVRGLRVEVERVDVEVMCRFLVPCAGGVATEVERVEVERLEVQRVEVEVLFLVPCAGGVATEASRQS